MSAQKNREAVVACMDDGLSIKGVLFGTAGSLVTGSANRRIKQGSIDLVNAVRGEMLPALAQLCKNSGIKFRGLTWHPDCGWATMNEIEPDQVGPMTEALAKELGIPFVGEVPFTNVPFPIAQGVTGYMKRKLHKHEAQGIIYTTGGGIDDFERASVLAQNGWKAAFVISADAASEMKHAPARDLLALETDVAETIMKTILPHRIYNAGIWPAFIAKANEAIVASFI